jgi:hypothetical protein
MDEDPWGRQAQRIIQFSYGPIVRYFRQRHVKNNYDKEPEWRRRGATLTTGYVKRW